jgi:hypothetical protein
LPKLGILCIYLRIFIDRPSRWICYALFVILALHSVVVAIMNIFICVPVAFMWDKRIGGGRCLNQALAVRYGSLTNIVTDVVMLVLPLPMVYRLKACIRVKLGVLATFLLGSM